MLSGWVGGGRAETPRGPRKLSPGTSPTARADKPATNSPYTRSRQSGPIRHTPPRLAVWGKHDHGQPTLLTSAFLCVAPKRSAPVNQQLQPPALVLHEPRGHSIPHPSLTTRFPYLPTVDQASSTTHNQLSSTTPRYSRASTP